MKESIMRQAVTALFCAAGAVGAEDLSRPNIILFFVDDLGWADVGFNGSSFHMTPQLDAFAENALVFTDAYAYPTCSPSRACLITGQNTPRHGIYHVAEYHPMPPVFKKIRDIRTGHFYEGGAPTIGEIMRDAGYVCGYAGKWHMGNRHDTLPQGRGFEMNAGGYSYGGPPSYFSPYMNPMLPDGPEGEYLPERLIQESIQFIRENRERPFFLIHAPYLVHRPIQPKSDYVELFESRVPDEGRSCPDYAAMVYAMDLAFGELIEALKEEGVFENTLIVFMSDNGVNPRDAKSTPLRGGKGSFYEGGIRVPMFAYWHGVTSPGISRVPVTVLDMIPTFLDAAGESSDGLLLDGESLMPLLRGNGSLHRDAIYWHHPCYMIPRVFSDPDLPVYWPPGEARMPPVEERGDWVRPLSVIRSGDYKLIREYETGTVELYNLAKDMGETRNLVHDEPAKASDLKKRLDLWLTEVGAVIPSMPNPHYNPEAVWVIQGVRH